MIKRRARRFVAAMAVLWLYACIMPLTALAGSFALLKDYTAELFPEAVQAVVPDKSTAAEDDLYELLNGLRNDLTKPFGRVSFSVFWDSGAEDRALFPSVNLQLLLKRPNGIDQVLCETSAVASADTFFEAQVSIDRLRLASLGLALEDLEPSKLEVAQVFDDSPQVGQWTPSLKKILSANGSIFVTVENEPMTPANQVDLTIEKEWSFLKTITACERNAYRASYCAMFSLTRDGTLTGDAVTIVGDGTAAFTGLPKYKLNGEKYVYGVIEQIYAQDAENPNAFITEMHATGEYSYKSESALNGMTIQGMVTWEADGKKVSSLDMISDPQPLATLVLQRKGESSHEGYEDVPGAVITFSEWDQEQTTLPFSHGTAYPVYAPSGEKYKYRIVETVRQSPEAQGYDLRDMSITFMSRISPDGKLLLRASNAVYSPREDMASARDPFSFLAYALK